MAYEELIKKAIETRENSYSPYSNFKVGAAVECESGKIYGGTNIENSSYGLTICAERVAITKAVSEGERKIVRIAVVTSSKELSFSCGACRQVLYEFGRDAEFLCCDPEGNYDLYSASELLPNYDIGGAFTQNLDKLK